MLDELERIKGVGDKNPDMALSMLDSLELEIRGENEYVKKLFFIYDFSYIVEWIL